MLDYKILYLYCICGFQNCPNSVIILVGYSFEKTRASSNYWTVIMTACIRQVTKEIVRYFELLSLHFSAKSPLGSQLDRLELGMVQSGEAVSGDFKYARLADLYAIFKYCKRSEIDTLWLRYFDKPHIAEEYYNHDLDDGSTIERTMLTRTYQSFTDCAIKAGCTPVAFEKRVKRARAKVRQAIDERDKKMIR